ncbi:hypothetical protein C7212DRAFT_345972 [Tuber magnatum]|uniref:Uncharacterized protein n=1 Tax=Tuber magnatum TaxID=42249 RepID=A0A317SN58_9PEZI|nr:hypothetical protein C7212DRAFT_345972 [Tuber magnatum]
MQCNRVKRDETYLLKYSSTGTSTVRALGHDGWLRRGKESGAGGAQSASGNIRREAPARQGLKGLSPTLPGDVMSHPALYVPNKLTVVLPRWRGGGSWLAPRGRESVFGNRAGESLKEPVPRPAGYRYGTCTLQNTAGIGIDGHFDQDGTYTWTCTTRRRSDMDTHKIGQEEEEEKGPTGTPTLP